MKFSISELRKALLLLLENFSLPVLWGGSFGIHSLSGHVFGPMGLFTDLVNNTVLG